MRFYLCPSKLLLYVFCFLYCNAAATVIIVNLHISWKIFILLIILYYLFITNVVYTLHLAPYSVIKIWRIDKNWYATTRAGLNIYGELDNCIYVSSLLIIICIKHRKRSKFIIIPVDSLSKTEFCYLSSLVKP